MVRLLILIWGPSITFLPVPLLRMISVFLHTLDPTIFARSAHVLLLLYVCIFGPTVSKRILTCFLLRKHRIILLLFALHSNWLRTWMTMGDFCGGKKGRWLYFNDPEGRTRPEGKEEMHVDTVSVLSAKKKIILTLFWIWREWVDLRHGNKYIKFICGSLVHCRWATCQNNTRQLCLLCHIWTRRCAKSCSD